MGMTTNNWLITGGDSNPNLAQSLSEIVSSKVKSGEYSARDISYLASLNRPVLSERLLVTADRLEKLRAMCQSWDIDFRPSQISSHRPFVGPIIVAFKKAIQPILKALLKDTITQQRNFNASVITAVTDLSNEVEKLRSFK